MDAFELLKLPRQLELSEEVLRAAFREAGKSMHPDAGGDEQDFAALQKAYALLESPSKRLRHLLELQGLAGDDRGTISHGLMTMFGEVASVLQQADEVVKRRESAQSALAKALLEPAVLSARDGVESLIGKVSAMLQGTLASCDVTAADGAWQAVRDLAFLEKWRTQLRQRFAALA